jgi:site-specific DNA-methyltransferase (adenine-specific)
MNLLFGDCREVLKGFPDCSFDSIVTDPPYELGFMGKKWDSSGVAYDVSLWAECLRVLKPGGHLLAFSGSRTYHRMVVAIEDAGFEIRDQIMWVYGSGFPKSMDISKAIDKAAGAERTVIGYSKGVGVSSDDNQYGGINRGAVGIKQVAVDVPVTAPATDEAQQWSGWGTALKPAHEPIVMARKPIEGTVANNVLKHGVGGINIDGCRVEASDSFGGGAKGTSGFADGYAHDGWVAGSPLGRFPANFIHDGSEEVLALFPDSTSKSGGKSGTNANPMSWSEQNKQRDRGGHDDSGSAARFFYCAKASKAERNAGLEELPEVRHADRNSTDGVGGDNPRNRTNQAKQNFHPTVKPIALMRYLVRLVTPPNGIVLDPFAGSGTTLVAATLERFNSVGIEMTEDYLPIIKGRVEWAEQQTADTLF